MLLAQRRLHELALHLQCLVLLLQARGLALLGGGALRRQRVAAAAASTHAHTTAASPPAPAATPAATVECAGCRGACAALRGVRCEHRVAVGFVVLLLTVFAVRLLHQREPRELEQLPLRIRAAARTRRERAVHHAAT